MDPVTMLNNSISIIRCIYEVQCEVFLNRKKKYLLVLREKEKRERETRREKQAIVIQNYVH